MAGKKFSVSKSFAKRGAKKTAVRTDSRFSHIFTYGRKAEFYHLREFIRACFHLQADSAAAEKDSFLIFRALVYHRREKFLQSYRRATAVDISRQRQKFL